MKKWNTTVIIAQAGTISHDGHMVTEEAYQKLVSEDPERFYYDPDTKYLYMGFECVVRLQVME